MGEEGDSKMGFQNAHCLRGDNRKDVKIINQQGGRSAIVK